MSVQNARKYLQELATDEEFAKQIAETGIDKTAKMELINSKGLSFNKNEYDKAVLNCKNEAISNGIYFINSDGNFDEEMMKQIAEDETIDKSITIGCLLEYNNSNVAAGQNMELDDEAMENINGGLIVGALFGGIFGGLGGAVGGAIGGGAGLGGFTSMIAGHAADIAGANQTQKGIVQGAAAVAGGAVGAFVGGNTGGAAGFVGGFLGGLCAPI